MKPKCLSILAMNLTFAVSGLNQAMGQPVPGAVGGIQTVSGQHALSVSGNGTTFFGQGYSGSFGQGSGFGSGNAFGNSYGQWYMSPYSQGYAGYTSPYASGYGISQGYGVFDPYNGGYPPLYGGYGAGQSQGGINASGLANLIRSEGEYNESNAKAAGEYQKARSQWIENQNRIHEELLSRKRSSQAIANQDHETARATRERQQEFIAAHRPPPLSSDLLDPDTGNIEWPVALKSGEFDGMRLELEALFEARSKNGVTAENRSQLLNKIRDTQDLLRGEVLQIPLPDYTESRRFLERMLASARQ